MQVRLSMMWLFAVLNYLYADVMSLMNPEGLRKIMTGQVGAVQITPGFLVGAALLMETAIAMVLLARLLPYRANRLANIATGILHTLAVLLSMVAVAPEPYYIVFAVVEVPCTILIVWFALRWRLQLSAVSVPESAAAPAGGSR